ncbi:hypothetical protein GCM10012320_08390 [Sinomonas cellulolyticus]|uniref:Replication-relaxation family protein n=1 Tax=Sinomonas cellulolyticus TaxID=2801916 RepID=A0ABS1K455_9MICC|nr:MULTISPECIES: replication-relaxation family protein [Sinomonas]MBL0706299.1 replication-relaxation family protein [Sinomonas cellulolyticus]GHG43939.1 hypothetical protein GCM10012320_08390 [Sinomonas sp. KCTC 49339]
MNARELRQLQSRLAERDRAILAALYEYRILSTDQIRRLFFATGHTTATAALRATTRVMSRLESLRLIIKVKGRVGGVQRGSAGLIYYLASGGETLVRTERGLTKRRRFVEPTLTFAAHTLAVAELAVQLHEAQEEQHTEVIALETEPTCWRTFAGPHGATVHLRPDLFLRTVSGDFEDSWFVEADRATESLKAILRKASIYQRYAASGTHQAEHGVFPAIVWVTSSIERRDAIARVVAADSRLSPELFRTTTSEDFMALILAGGAPP